MDCEKQDHCRDAIEIAVNFKPVRSPGISLFAYLKLNRLIWGTLQNKTICKLLKKSYRWFIVFKINFYRLNC